MSYARTAVTRMTLDMSRPDLQRSETVTLGDTNRRWEVTLINGGAPFRLPPNWTAALTGIKPDGTGLLNGCSVADGKIIYDFAAGAEIATCAGNYPVQFDIWDEVGDLVASPKIYINVLEDARPHAELESNGQYTLIGEMLSRVDDAEQDISNNAKGIENNRKNIEQTGKDVSKNKENIDLLVTYVPSADMLTIPKEAWKENEEKKYSTTLGESQENTYITLWAADEVTKKWLDENDTEVKIVDEEIIVSAKSKPGINLNIVKLVELYHNDTDETDRHVELVGLMDESERLNLGNRMKEAEKKLESAEVIGGQVSVKSSDWEGSKAIIKLPIELNTLTLLWPDNEVSSLIVNTQRIYISYSFINHETGEVPLIRGVEEDYKGDLQLRYVRLPMINEDTQTAAVQIIGVRYSGSGGGGGSTTIEKTTGEIITIDVDSWSETKSVGLSTWITGPIQLSNITDTTMVRLTALNETTATDWTAGQVGAEITTDEESEIYNLRIGIIGAKPTMEWQILIESLIVEESENTAVGPYITVVPPASDAVNKIAEHNYDEKSHPDLREQTEKNTANLAGLAERVIDKTVSDLVNYYTKSETLTKAEINALVSTIPKFKIEVVSALPTSNISETTVYLVKSGDDDTNLYTEYIRTNGKWEKLGAQTVDLTGYATEAWVNDVLTSYVKTVDMEAYVTGLLNSYLTKDDAAKTYQPMGDYPTTDDMDTAISNATENLAPQSSIPTKVSQLSNDKEYLTPTTGDPRYAAKQTTEDALTEHSSKIVELEKALENATIEPADSVEWLEENGDTSKKYVLPDGYIYAWMAKLKTIVYNAKSLLTANYRTGQGQNMKHTAKDLGCAITSAIEVDNTITDYKLNIYIADGGKGQNYLYPKYYSPLYIYYYKKDESQIGWNNAKRLNLHTDSGTNIDLPIGPVNIATADCYNGSAYPDCWSQTKYIRIVIGVGNIDLESNPNLIDGLVINLEPLNQTVTEYGWHSTGQQHSNDKATQQNTADIATLKEEVAVLKENATALREDIDKIPRPSGAVWYALGDSITKGEGWGGVTAETCWYAHVLKYNGYDPDKSRKIAYSGLGFAKADPNFSKTARTLVDENDFSAVDLVTIAIGINDWKETHSLDTVKSEMGYCFEKILGDNPCCKIFFITPMNVRMGSKSTNWAFGYSGGTGGNLGQFVEAQVSVCKDYGIQVIDMTYGSVVNRENIETILADAYHPTPAGHLAMARELARKITFV